MHNLLRINKNGLRTSKGSHIMRYLKHLLLILSSTLCSPLLSMQQNIPKGKEPASSSRTTRSSNNQPQADPMAYYPAGLVFEESGDYENAVKNYELAIQEKVNYADACINLANLLSKGLGAKADIPRAIKLYKRAIESGRIDQYYNLGLLYENLQDYDRAFINYELAIEKNPSSADSAHLNLVNDSARHNLANLFMSGRGCTRDVSKAKAMLEELARKNNAYALYSLGIAYLGGIEGIQKDPQKGRDYLLKAERKIEGSNDESERLLYPRVLIALGSLSEWGIGTGKSIKDASTYYTKADSIRGKTHLARLVLTGKARGDIEKAKEDLKSYSPKDAVAAYIYGTLLLEEGKSEDAVRVFETISKQADFPLVLLQLGIASHYGVGTVKDEKKGTGLF